MVIWMKSYSTNSTEEQRRSSVDCIGGNPEIVGEATDLRISKIGSVQPIQQIDEDAERKDEEVEFQVQCT